MSKEPLSFTVEDFREALGGEPEDIEIDMLADAYPSYKIKSWRLVLLEGLKQGKSNTEILADKLKAKKIDPETDQSMGGHTRMIDSKLRRAAIRMLYLRHIRDGKTRRQANALVWKAFPDLTQNTIAFNTRKR